MMLTGKTGSIPYKDTNAAPGSDLHKWLTLGKVKEAEACHKATQERERQLMESIDRRMGIKNGAA